MNLHVQPLNPKQDQLLRSIRENVFSIAMGAAGTGKTWCSLASAATLLQQGRVRKIVLVRTNIPTGRSLGFMPGTMEEKMEPWLAPMLNVLKERLGKGHYQYNLSKENIQFQPLETIRGTSFDNTFIAVDEAQNLTMEELKAITTRIGQHSKLVLMGDPSQSDLRRSALWDFYQLCQKHSITTGLVEFGVDDIVRSDIVGDLVRMFIAEGI